MIRLAIFITFISTATIAQEIAITFDDAPTPDGPLFTGTERSERILKSLRDHNVDEVAFFVLTKGIDRSTDKRLERYAEAGHLLANHSHSHPWMHESGASAYISDIQHADSILNGYPNYVKWFRYPYLDEGRTRSARDSVRTALSSFRLSNGYVTVDNYDWYLNSLLGQAKKKAQAIDMDILRDIYVSHIYESILFYDAIAKMHLGRSPKHVLLLHENDIAALFLGDLISNLKDRGWKIISPREAYADPIATQVPDVLFNGQGRVAAMANAKGIPPRELVQQSEDEHFLDELVRARKPFK